MRESRNNKLGLIRNYGRRRDHAVDRKGVLLAEVGLELRIGNVSAFSGWSGSALPDSGPVLFVCRPFRLARRPGRFLIFRFRWFRFLFMLGWLCFLLPPRRIHFRRSWRWRNFARLIRLFLSGRAGVLCRLLSISSENSHTHEQGYSRRNCHSVHIQSPCNRGGLNF